MLIEDALGLILMLCIAFQLIGGDVSNKSLRARADDLISRFWFSKEPVALKEFSKGVKDVFHRPDKVRGINSDFPKIAEDFSVPSKILQSR